METASQPNGQTRPVDSEQAFSRFRRGLGRFLGENAARRGVDAASEHGDLELAVMLLHEENARLKTELHRPRDVGVMIDRLRGLGSGSDHDELVAETASLLSECLRIRDGLHEACADIQAAIGAVQERLGNLSATIETSNPDLGAPERRAAVANDSAADGVNDLDAPERRANGAAGNGANGAGAGI
jgi:hypothetical protein